MCKFLEQDFYLNVVDCAFCFKNYLWRAEDSSLAGRVTNNNNDSGNRELEFGLTPLTGPLLVVIVQKHHP